MITSFDPRDARRVVAEVPAATPAEVAAAIERAQAVQPRWASNGPSRARALGALADAVSARGDELADLMVREVGKPVTEARGEVVRAEAVLRFYAQVALDPVGELLPSPDGRSELRAERVPRGVIAAVCPWNFPLAIPFWKAAPALAFGNAVVLKPASAAVATGVALAELAREALPEGVLTVLPLRGRDAGALLDDDRVAAVTFTGSTETGQALAQRLATRGALLQAELGGQNPAIVLDDAAIPAAADAIVAGAMGYAGQKCTATRRVIADRAVASELRDALAERVRALAVGDPADPGTTAGPLIDGAAVDEFRTAVAGALEHGAAVIAESEAAGDGAGYVRPALLEADDPHAAVNLEETFGPLLTFLTCEGDDEAVQIANTGRFGLVGAVHSRDLARGAAVARRLRCGMQRVNAPTPGVDYFAPFGGTRQSGIGPREQGRAVRDFCTEWRTLLVAPAAG